MQFKLVAALSLIIITTGGVASAQTQWVNEPQTPVIAPDLHPTDGIDGRFDGHRYPLDIVKVDGVYHIYFTSRTENGDGTVTLQIDHATSPDGLTWDLDSTNPVLRQGAEGEWDHGSIPGAAVIHDGTEFRMWYAAVTPGNLWGGSEWLGVGYATSHDGSSWAKYTGNPIIEPECSPSFGNFHASSVPDTPIIPQSVILDEDENGFKYLMWSTNDPVSGQDDIQVTRSRDGLEWFTDYYSTQIEGEGWNDNFSLSVDFDGTNFHIVAWEYFGYWPYIRYAISEDHHQWTVPVSSDVPGLDPQGPWGFSPVVLADDGVLTVWYGGGIDTGIYRATSNCCSTVYTRFIPAAAHGAGSHGSFYRTDAHLCNDGETTAEYRFAWFPRGRDNADWIRSGFFNLGPGMCESYTGILEVVFGLEPGAFGALAVESSSRDLLVTAEIVTSQRGTSTAAFGQSLPIIQETGSPGSNQRIEFLGDLAGARCNVTCFNLFPRERDLELYFYSSGGAYLETRTMVLPSWGSDQLNRIFDRYGSDSGYVRVDPHYRGWSYYCFGSVVDNESNAVKIIPPQ